MFRSVRSRLTCWYTGILALVLIVFCVAVYIALSRDSYGDVDASLAASIDVLSRSLRQEVEENHGKIQGEEAFRDVVSTIYEDSFPDVSVAVVEGGRSVANKPGVGGRVPRIPKPLTPGYVTESRADGSWRVESVSVPVPRAGSYTFVAETSLTPVRAEMSQLRGVFYTAIPLALAIAALGGYILAFKSLAPVVAMSSIVEKIGSQDLSQRVAVVNEHDELGKLASTFNRLLERIEHAFESQKHFMADSSHELRTPIYVARTATDVILSGWNRSEEEYRDALTTIQQQLRRLSRIVEAMFMLSNADARAYPVSGEDFYLGDVISECLRAARVLGQAKGIRVIGREPAEMPCYGDQGLIRQLILALLDNAIKYTSEGGRVEVKVACGEPGPYCLEVSDTGPGIPEDAREHIFDRFFRADRTASRTGAGRNRGAGLGLAIAHWIAEAHHGTLTLTESSSSGSTFQVRLPRQTGDGPG